MLHLLLLIMLHQDGVYSLTLNCLPHESCSCRNTVQEIEWEIFCSLPEEINLTVSLNNDETATLHCHDMDTWPPVEIEIFKLTGTKIGIEFDQCSLPEWPLSNMIGSIENEIENKLEISGLTTTMSKLTRRNFLRLPRIDILWVSSSGVVEFSANALQDLSDLQRIHFWGNDIPILPRGIFKGLTKLKELRLHYNKMQHVDSMLFQNLSELEWLEISNNHLESLEPGTFKDLVNLRILDIGYNYLKTLPEYIFRPLEKLKRLYMSGNEFFSLPQRLFIGNSGLDTLEFSENRGNLSSLPDEFFGDLASLLRVILSGNNFTELPENIFVASPRVGCVYLDRNKLCKIREKTFKNLTWIYEIDLSNNELNNLPDGLFEGSKELWSLNLQNNAITSISRNLLANSNKWMSVNFGSNQISEIESWSFSNFTHRFEVSLKKNDLANLPENILWGSFYLWSLDISENKLTDLPVKLFRDSTNLMSLRLNANKLKNLPEGIFQGLDKLSDLDLQKNGFTTLPYNALAQKTSLRYLRLDFNRMTEINLSHLVCLSSIEFAYFSHNLINSIITSSRREDEEFSCHKRSNLIDLALDHNNMTYFAWNELYIFDELSVLNLSCNRISSVELFSLDFMNEAVFIDITRNNIKKLPPIDRIPLNPQVRLYIEDNTIDCGCEFYQLKKYFDDRTRFKFNVMYVITSDNLTCSQPVSMLESPVKNMEMKLLECKLHDSDKPRICRGDCYCTWRASDDTLVVNCSYRKFTRAPYDFDGFEGSAIELDLTGNFITEMSFFHKHSWRKYKYEKVRKIFLSRNRIRNITFDVVPRNLSVLHLDHNNLTRLHVAVADTMRNTTSLQELSLHSNPWSCDEETREAFNILKEKLDRKIGHAFGKSCLDSRHNRNGDEKPTSYITYQMF